MVQESKSLAVQYVNLDSLIVNERNSREHGDDVLQIAKSIKHFGWTNPILLQKGTNKIIGGHGRALAALKLGIEQVPVIYLGLDDLDARRYTITDNRTAENSKWNMPILKDELAELNDGAFDLGTLGFDEESLKGLIDYEMTEEGEDDGEGDNEAPMVVCPKCYHEFEYRNTDG